MCTHTLRVASDELVHKCEWPLLPRSLSADELVSSTSDILYICIYMQLAQMMINKLAQICRQLATTSTDMVVTHKHTNTHTLDAADNFVMLM